MNVKRLNERFGQLFGFVYGRPRFAWVLSDELKFPVPAGERQSDGGIYYVSKEVTFERQIQGPRRWVVAALIDPPPESQWREQMGPAMPYPGQGYYVATDQMCRVGVEPTDELTDFVAAAIRKAKDATETEKVDLSVSLGTREEDSVDKRISDAVDDSIPAFGNIPGKRGGHVSFGGLKAEA